jgi:hypothetical protein
MSAKLSPDCGRACGSLETLTTTAGRAASARSVIGNPVKGITGSGGGIVVVVVDDDDVVVDSSTVVVGFGLVVGGVVSGAAVVAGEADAPLHETRASAAIRMEVVFL